MSGDPFVTHRRLLFTVAYEMLGSAADAEDVVQETWLKWAEVDQAEVRDPRAFLVRIVTRKVPGINERLAGEITRFMETLRTVRLAKVPGVAETLDWAQALVSLHADHLDHELVTETLGCVLKDPDDIKRVRRQLESDGMKRFLAVEA